MTLTRRQAIASFISLAALASAAPAAVAASADDYVHKLGVEVLRLAQGGSRGDKALQRRFAALLTRYINIPGIANFALGPARANLPAGDRAMFYELVSNYAAALFVWYVTDFQGSDLKITSSSQQGAFTMIDSQIVGSNQPVKWRVGGTDGGMRIVDINVQGVWLTIAMKDLFTRTLNASHGDFKPLYARLREADTW
ncbi:MAG TPA: ABC transporter substrate-binding protein [Aestuariivirga sp.]